MSSKFAAIELKGHEDAHAGIQAFFEKAEGLGLAFKFLEPYGTVIVGRIKLLRFQTDCSDLELMLPFFQEDNRSFVFPTKTGYSLHTQTTQGLVPVTTMQATKLTGYQRRYRGTADKFWKRQFS